MSEIFVSWVVPAVTAFTFAAITLAIIVYFVVPAITLWRYRCDLTDKQFALANADQGAGSDDIKYYTAYFDARHEDLQISGIAPVAKYWQIGLFDNRFRQLDRGHLNHRTVERESDGRFQIRVTRHADCTHHNHLICDDSPRGIIIFRVLHPHGDVQSPAITRIVRQ